MVTRRPTWHGGFFRLISSSCADSAWRGSDTMTASTVTDGRGYLHAASYGGCQRCWLRKATLRCRLNSWREDGTHL